MRGSLILTLIIIILAAKKVGKAVSNGTLAEKPRDIYLFISYWFVYIAAQKVKTGVVSGTLSRKCINGGSLF